MNFPINTRMCNELLSDYYQRVEDFVKLTTQHYLQIDYYIKPISANEWHSGRINYDKYGRLTEIKLGSRITNFNYFGYDMMTGSEVKTIVENQITYKAYNEEKLIDNKVVESVTKFYDDGMNLSNTIREIRLMK